MCFSKPDLSSDLQICPTTNSESLRRSLRGIPNVNCPAWNLEPLQSLTLTVSSISAVGNSLLPVTQAENYGFMLDISLSLRPHIQVSSNSCCLYIQHISRTQLLFSISTVAILVEATAILDPDYCEGLLTVLTDSAPTHHYLKRATTTTVQNCKPGHAVYLLNDFSSYWEQRPRPSQWPNKSRVAI